MVNKLTEKFFSFFDGIFPADPRGEFSCPELPGAAASLAAAWCAKQSPARIALVITSGAAESSRLFLDVLSLQKNTGIEALLFAQEIEDDPDAIASRLKTVRRLTAPADGDIPPAIIIASAKAILVPAPDPEQIRSCSITLKEKGFYEISELAASLTDIGYDRVEIVEEPGQFAVRGGIIDIWPPVNEFPCRAEFFDTELESLRTFDPVTQCSVTSGLESVWIAPCSKKRASGRHHLTDLLPPGSAVLWNSFDEILSGIVYETTADCDGAEQWKKLREKTKSASPCFELCAGASELTSAAELQILASSFSGLGELGAEVARHPGLLASAREKILMQLMVEAGDGKSVLVCTDTAGTAEMLNRECMRLLPQVASKGGQALSIGRLPLSGGFCIPGLIVAAQSDLYAVRKKNTLVRAHRSSAHRAAIEHADDLEPGDIVVHVEHGIGRFLGTTEIEVAGVRSEVFTIEYAERAKLHVPITQAHLLGKYVGVAGHRVRLHKLGGRRWTKEKAEAAASVRSLAGALLETQARRSISEGISFNPEPQWMPEFEAGFPYRETADQLKAIEAVKADMAGRKPMDRLICGDAGYGKTEVAMRSAFIAVMNGYQVAVLVPTTILAEQHYETFLERMADFPVTVRVVDRFHGSSARRKLQQEARTGAADIIIGTHALLSNGISFKNLGLLIIDEEQRFGVAHKEKLKAIRQTVDVLTMSATPIPRTLYMSMTGARDMSQLQTPPRERVAVETKIARDTDEVYVEAIRRELERGGQCYVLYNRVATIGMMEKRLRRLLPEARIAVGHGQLPAGELSEVMKSFQNGEIDVLLCTTIVESGLDIPRANTIIVDRADRFGIADLYQLRGRVGRAAQRGFAWFLTPNSGYVDGDARERLAAIKRHSGLGAGFNLALRDLEIRGAGNLLGREQSGQIAAVGFNLYCQLLKRTIAVLKGEKPPILVDTETSFDFLSFSPGSSEIDNAACISYGYIEDEGMRIAFHRRLAELSTLDELEILRRETADRFGRPDAAAQRLFKMAEIKITAAAAGLRRIESKNGKIMLFPNDSADAIFVDGRIPRHRNQNVDKRLSEILQLARNLPDLKKKNRLS